jgi:putative copper resistance protein D
VPVLLEAAPVLPAFTWGGLVTRWEIDPYLTILTIWVVGLYLSGVWTLRRRGDAWPWTRTVSFVVVGMGSFFYATSSALGTYDTTLLSVHMVQHMILSMAVPIFLALGAPVTLALRTVPRKPRAVLLSVLHSRVAKVLTFPPLVFVLYIITPWTIYFTHWYDGTLHNTYIHEMTHVHLVLAGSLFFWPLLGIDPVPGRVAYPFRVLLAVLTMPFHAFLGVTIMGQKDLIGGSWYPSLHATMPWLPDAFSDQRLAGAILWGSGDLVGLLVFAVLFVQWVRHAMRENEREDRRLDLLEARTAREAAASSATAAD